MSSQTLSENDALPRGTGAKGTTLRPEGHSEDVKSKESKAEFRWEWVGPAQKHEDVLLHYTACQQVFETDSLAPTVYRVGDVIYSNVDGDPVPWVAQVLDFCMDPSIAASLEAEASAENESSSDESRDIPSWMPMRVSLRWMYRLADVEEDKGQKVKGHTMEVFLSDHVTGPEVNSVNVIDGAATLRSDHSLLKEKNDKDDHPVYLCQKFYRHSTASKPPKDTVSAFYPAKAKSIRDLVPGELELILQNPSLSDLLYFKQYPGLPDPRPNSFQVQSTPSSHSRRTARPSSQQKSSKRTRRLRPFLEEDQHNVHGGPAGDPGSRTAGNPDSQKLARGQASGAENDEKLEAITGSKRRRQYSSSESGDNFENFDEDDLAPSSSKTRRSRTVRLSSSKNDKRSKSSLVDMSGSENELMSVSPEPLQALGDAHGSKCLRSTQPRASARRASARIQQASAMLDAEYVYDDNGDMDGAAEGEDTVDEEDNHNDNSLSEIKQSVSRERRNGNEYENRVEANEISKTHGKVRVGAGTREPDLAQQASKHDEISSVLGPIAHSAGQSASESIVNLEPAVQEPPENRITKAFEALTDDQRVACRRNLPWILEAMQQGMMDRGGSDNAVTDEMMANVVVDVMRKYSAMGLTERQRSSASNEM